VVLGTLPDETVLQADLVLPLSTTLESWADDERLSSDGQPIATLNPPAMHPLHDTRSLLQIITELAGPVSPSSVGGNDAQLPGDAAEAAIQRHWQRLQELNAPGQPFPTFWEAAVQRGGVWSAGAARPAAAAPGAALQAGLSALAAAPAPAPATPSADYPYHLRLYESPVFGGDGSGSWLSWLQELPDPTTSAMWSSWVEIHPQLAERLGLKQGDGVWVESRAGRIELPVFLFPGLHPGTVAVPAGQGHSAGDAPTNRGANAYALLDAEHDPETGTLAWEATHVKLTPSGRRLALPLFGRSLQQAITHR